MPEYRPHHDSIRAQVAEVIGAAALCEHHRALARKLATWPAPKEAAARRYALRHTLTHRAEAGAWEDAWRLAADMGFGHRASSLQSQASSALRGFLSPDE